YHTYFLGLLADALVRLGRPEEALGPLDEGLAGVSALSERLHEAELHRLKGCALLGARPRRGDGMGDRPGDRPGDEPPGAADCFERALAAARGQGARWYEWRAANDLAALLRSRGQSQEAADLVAAAAAGLDGGPP